MTIRTILLTASALILAAACNPSATEAPAPAPAPAAPIADAATPAPSGPAAENTPDSLSSTPAAPVMTPEASAAPAAPAATAAALSSETLATARATYASTCSMCHGSTGQGTPQLGVALTNIHDVGEIKNKITKGMVEPGDSMPPMGAALSPTQLDALAAFIAAGLPQ